MSPLATLAAWIEEARAQGDGEPEAMALATVGADGAPSVRMVLCRGIDDDAIRFFTNYDSRKSRELAAHARAAVAFHWGSLKRQVRVEGDVTRLDEAASDAYFRSRPRGHQLNAWASAQSSRIESLDEVRKKLAEMEKRFAGGEVPRPPNWGGFSIRARAVELWIGGADRLHERVLYQRAPGGWTTARLSP